jgi:hypothetical protein
VLTAAQRLGSPDDDVYSSDIMRIGSSARRYYD